MSLRSRSRWLAAATAIAVPALVLSTACSTDKAAGPGAVATADTIALNEANTNVIEWSNNSGSDSGYTDFNGANLIQTFLDGSGNFNNARLLMQYSLPKLAGKGVVDSAKMYNFVCLNQGDPITDSVVVDHVSWGAVYQDSAAWAGMTLQANIGTLVRDTTTGWKSLDVTSSIQGDYSAKRTTSQYRFEYAFGTEPVGDRVVWLEGGSCGEGSPQPADAGQGYVVIWAH
jgi:hypothetical protein